MVRRGDVVDGEKNAGQHLIYGDKQRSTTQGVQPIDLGQFAQKERLPNLTQTCSLINPIPNFRCHANLPR